MRGPLCRGRGQCLVAGRIHVKADDELVAEPEQPEHRHLDRHAAGGSGPAEVDLGDEVALVGLAAVDDLDLDLLPSLA